MTRRRKAAYKTSVLAFIGTLAAVTAAHAQGVTVDLGEGGITERALQLIALITVLSIAPSILIMVTSFTRIVVVLSLLRAALGTQTAPPNTVLVSLALFLTAFIMAPVFTTAYNQAVTPMIAGEITPQEAFDRATPPFRTFMLEHVREKDLRLFTDLAQETAETPEEVSLRALVPAFMISELRRAFEIGFLLFVPFLVIDLVVASILMSRVMRMLPTVISSLPFKLFFFVLGDCWNRVAGSLVASFVR